MISLTARDYAKADILVTEKEFLKGEPTLPLGFVLDIANQQAEYEENDQDAHQE